ncbi:MAG: class I SAM-dependent methyltransferase, partial [Actinobacteria bacterium]|nr:class I SAM-dependent methyltransferase [Actinomycetota bacterium]
MVNVSTISDFAAFTRDRSRDVVTPDEPTIVHTTRGLYIARRLLSARIFQSGSFDMSLKTIARDCVNASLRPIGIQIVRGRTNDPAIKSFLPAKKTTAAARRAGLSIGDYIDQKYAEAGATAASVDAMLRLSALTDSVERVCEIGPGSGRYAEKVIAALRPQVYEAYETASDWWPHLRTLPNLITQPCDGHTLTNTKSASVDLVHAHKVFVYIPFVTTVGYLQEMARVVRPGGAVAFDVVTEDC